ncbi:hypothetical protein [Xylocopilactobacillus apis]|uniref:Surface layer protein A domain-containing protein n=1 Tax=Xylocopilactobacillus apis TaxID=2932183 RepID=A0AAU9DBV6_9LACO|nr:hypothetical protein [Xylocopilactobacillus apis]BDR55651.1 hypothetical protein KIMC2_02130 [Xylocopilactobacillus apis]
MKRKILDILFIFLTFLGISSTANAAVQNVTPYTGYLAYVRNYGIRLYKNSGVPSNTYLLHGTAWKISAKNVDTLGRTWCRVGNDQWVPQSNITLKNPNYSTVLTISAHGKKTKSYTLYHSPSRLSPIKNGLVNKKVAVGSSWKVTQSATNGAEIWYNLGGNQWISGMYTTMPATAGPSNAPTITFK